MGNRQADHQNQLAMEPAVAEILEAAYPQQGQAEANTTAMAGFMMARSRRRSMTSSMAARSLPGAASQRYTTSRAR